MATKKVTTKKKKAKRDIFDFIKDAGRQDSPVGIAFFTELKKKGVKAKDLTQLLKGWGYDAVDLKEDVTKLLSIYKARPLLQEMMNAMSQRAY
jgi:hypothetical protein